MTKQIQRISPFLWFDNQAEEAVNFYTSIFPNSRIDAIVRYREAGPGPKDSVMTIAFELDGQTIHHAERRASLKAMLQMKKLDIAGLQRAYEQV
jgi:predicted 3-demethylubiquinone-9 3-methyltransferase (glyoxalase superfamily)